MPGVTGGNNVTATNNKASRIGSGHAPAPGNGGVPISVPVEVIVPANRGRRLLAQVNNCCPVWILGLKD